MDELYCPAQWNIVCFSTTHVPHIFLCPTILMNTGLGKALPKFLCFAALDIGQPRFLCSLLLLLCFQTHPLLVGSGHSQWPVVSCSEPLHNSLCLEFPPGLALQSQLLHGPCTGKPLSRLRQSWGHNLCLYLYLGNITWGKDFMGYTCRLEVISSPHTSYSK